MERLIQDCFERDDSDIRNERSHNKTFQPTGNNLGVISGLVSPAAEIPRWAGRNREGDSMPKFEVGN